MSLGPAAFLLWALVPQHRIARLERQDQQRSPKQWLVTRLAHRLQLGHQETKKASGIYIDCLIEQLAVYSSCTIRIAWPRGSCGFRLTWDLSGLDTPRFRVEMGKPKTYAI